ncbi:MAG: hypothetical protein H7Z21_05205 [Hymenobacter sp.]|nr:hypothetical protein [Hymenobacter sp.]
MKIPPARATARKRSVAASVVDYKLFAIFSALVLLVLAVVLFKECLTARVAMLCHLVLALGVAGMTAALPGFIRVKNEMVSAGGSLAVFVLLVLTKPVQLLGPDSCEPMAVVAHLQQRNGDFRPFVGQQVALYLGQHRIGQQEVGRQGYATFANIPGSYRGDSVTLRPLQPTIRVISQNKPVIKVSQENIRFELRLVADTMRITGRLLVNDRTLAGAIVVFNNQFRAVTDATGAYALAVPFSKDSVCEARIVYRGDEIWRQQKIVSANSQVNFTFRRP